MGVQRFEDLQAWQEARELCIAKVHAEKRDRNRIGLLIIAISIKGGLMNFWTELHDWERRSGIS